MRKRDPVKEPLLRSDVASGAVEGSRESPLEDMVVVEDRVNDDCVDFYISPPEVAEGRAGPDHLPRTVLR